MSIKIIAFCPACLSTDIIGVDVYATSVKDILSGVKPRIITMTLCHQCGKYIPTSMLFPSN